MNMPRSMTKAEVAAGMIVEAENELTKCKIMARVHSRIQLRGGNPSKNQIQADAMNEQRMNSLERLLEDLRYIAKDELEKEQKDEAKKDIPAKTVDKKDKKKDT